MDKSAAWVVTTLESIAATTDTNKYDENDLKQAADFIRANADEFNEAFAVDTP